MTANVSAPARHVRPVLTDRLARKLHALARELVKTDDPVIAESLTRRACRAAGFKFDDRAGELFADYARTGDAWDKRVEFVMTPHDKPLPADAIPSGVLLEDAVAALTAFVDYDPTAA